MEKNPELGFYVMSFFKHGKWVEVMIDDRLMVLGGKQYGYTSESLILAQCLHHDDPDEVGNELWVPLLEKAYAKLHGGYQNIEGGKQTYAVTDLTGAAPVVFSQGSMPWNAELDNEERVILRLAACKELNIKMMAGLSVEHAGTETDIGNGILAGHQYSLIKMIETNGKLPLLALLRNPWGNTEWTGKWSDRDSVRWTPENKRITGHDPLGGDTLEGGDNGEFVMEFKEMLSVFNNVEMSLLFPTGFFRTRVKGQWLGNNAAGCGNEGGEAVYLRNPQYLLDIPDPPTPGMTCFGQILLTQPDVRYTQEKQRLYNINYVQCSTITSIID